VSAGFTSAETPEMLLSQADISLGVNARRWLQESREVWSVNYDYLALNNRGKSIIGIICQYMAFF
jgi:hypothetical protein